MEVARLTWQCQWGVDSSMSEERPQDSRKYLGRERMIHFKSQHKEGLWEQCNTMVTMVVKIRDFFLRFYLFIHVRHTERGRDIGRGRSRLHAGSSMQDSIPGLQDHDLSWRQTLNLWATQVPQALSFSNKAIFCYLHLVKYGHNNNPSQYTCFIGEWKLRKIKVTHPRSYSHSTGFTTGQQLFSWFPDVEIHSTHWWALYSIAVFLYGFSGSCICKFLPHNLS